MTSDALSTAVFVLGSDEGMRLTATEVRITDLKSMKDLIELKREAAPKE